MPQVKVKITREAYVAMAEAFPDELRLDAVPDPDGLYEIPIDADVLEFMTTLDSDPSKAILKAARGGMQ